MLTLIYGNTTLGDIYKNRIGTVRFSGDILSVV